MKKLKPKQIGPWCTFCPPKTKKAAYRQESFSGGFCCDEHKALLKKDEEAANLRDERHTEADFQSWGRL